MLTIPKHSDGKRWKEKQGSKDMAKLSKVVWKEVKTKALFSLLPCGTSRTMSLCEVGITPPFAKILA